MILTNIIYALFFESSAKIIFFHCNQGKLYYLCHVNYKNNNKDNITGRFAFMCCMADLV